jgi:hypothetical protein
MVKTLGELRSRTGDAVAAIELTGDQFVTVHGPIAVNREPIKGNPNHVGRSIGFINDLRNAGGQCMVLVLPHRSGMTIATIQERYVFAFAVFNREVSETFCLIVTDSLI